VIKIVVYIFLLLVFIRKGETIMLLSIAQIIVAGLVLYVLYFGYFKKNVLAKFAAFIILAAIMLIELLHGFAGLISDVDFLNFLETIFNGIAGLVIYAELVGLIVLLFFTKLKYKDSALKWALIAYVVLVLLIEFGLFK
jgi:hypothetical protein